MNKQSLKSLWLVFVMLCMSLDSMAYNFCVDGIYYQKRNSTEVYVTYYDTWYSGNNKNGYSGDVSIPQNVTYDGVTYNVTGIDNDSFNGCENINSISIPSSITFIGGNAFAGCNNLKKADFESIEALCKIQFDNENSNPLTITKCLFIDGEEIKDVVIPNTVMSIGNYTFRNCSGITSVTIPNSVTSIGTNAFCDCSNLTDLTIGNSVTNIDVGAFARTKLTSVTIPNSVTSIGNVAFLDCTRLTSLEIGNCVKSIGDDAFAGSSTLINISIPSSVTTIGANAFSKALLILESETPATIGWMGNEVTFVVPDNALETYKSAPGWTDMQGRISAKSKALLDLTTYAADGQLKLAEAVGIGNEQSVVSLKLHGTLNGYDLMVIRNKMKNLRILDMSDASIVADEGYEYYSGCRTANDVLGDNVFSGVGNLWTVVLPKNITSIGSGAFSDCSDLMSIDIPESVKTIGSWAFYHCSSLKDLKLPNTLKSIGHNAFALCYSLVDLKLPASLERIEYYAFYACRSLSAIHLPSMLTYIGDNAFTECGKKDVYVYTLSPFSISQSAFDFNGVLHAPQEPYSVFLDYYTNTQWSQFANVVPFEAKYSSWYMGEDQDITLNDGETIPNEDEEQAEGEMAPGSGLNYQDGAYQWLDKLNLKWKEGHAPSLIDNSSVFVDELIFTLDVKAGKWYFFCFPFDIEFDKAKFNGKFAWRYYDGDERASNGQGGWKNVGGNKLNKFQGYIFQTNKSGEIELTINNPVFTGGDKDVNVESHPSNNNQDAGWNFIGNPTLSHYDLSCFIESFNCPITVWDPVNNTYNAIVPGDDDYTFSPFEAFFVQKPAGTNAMTFEADNRQTGNQAQASQNAKAVSRMMKAINPERLIVNLTISNGQMEDKTRVVFNDKKSLFYDEGCDAGKFLSTENVPQIYTIDGKNVKYAINERPNNGNIVKLGYKASAEGTYTICAKRMDYQMAIKDTKTGITHNFSDGDYEFTSEAGTFDDRFVLMPSSEATNIKSLQAAGIVVESGNGYIALGGLNGKTASVYGANGVKVATITDNGRTDVAAGAYIIKVGDYSSKVVVK